MIEEIEKQEENQKETREEIIERLTEHSCELGYEHIVGMNEQQLLAEIKRMVDFTEVAAHAYNWLSELYPESAREEGIRIIREEFGYDSDLQSYVLFCFFLESQSLASLAIDLTIEKIDVWNVDMLKEAIEGIVCWRDCSSEMPNYPVALAAIKKRIASLNQQERDELSNELESFEKYIL